MNKTKNNVLQSPLFFYTQYPENNFKNHETCEETGKCGHIEQKIQSIESDQQMTELLELAEKDLKKTYYKYIKEFTGKDTCNG